ncbi:senescence-associated gene 12 protein [Perilla frutescens var. frutescens]|nr:senescence-associated gene 12 protein [Perilla frutescens var. frutescens]
MAFTRLLFNKHIITAFLLVQIWTSLVAGRTLPLVSMLERHEQWMTQHRRSYKDAAEKAQRLKIFKQNVQFIDSFNAAQNRSYKLAVNNFADLTNEEFLSTRTGFKMGYSRHNSSSFRYAHVAKIPSSIDWRTKGAVTDVKDQGRCSCCWAFSAVAAIEGINQVSRGNLVSLSAQELVDCDTNESRGCHGGFFDSAFEFIIRNKGLSTEADYPYEGVDGWCNAERDYSSRIGDIRGYENVPANSESALMKAVANQPVSVAIDASGYEFKYYTSGVFTGHCGTDLNHAVTVVGYGKTGDGIKYWVVKNSWGTNWGESGYVRLQRDSGTMGGLCGIAMHASYPIA